MLHDLIVHFLVEKIFQDETCSFKTDKVAATVSSQVNITEVGYQQWLLLCLYVQRPTQKDEDMILDAVANVGPVSICYDVSSDFRFYKKGVYSRCVYDLVYPFGISIVT